MNRNDLRRLPGVSGQPSLQDSEHLKEAERFFEWARSFERKGLKVAADAMRDEGRKAFEQFLTACGHQLSQA